MPQFSVDALYREIGKKITEHRARAGLSKAFLAREIDCSRPTVVNVEKGKQHATLELLFRIAERLGISYLELLPTSQEVAEQSKGDDVESESVNEPQMTKAIKEQIGIVKK